MPFCYENTNIFLQTPFKVHKQQLTKINTDLRPLLHDAEDALDAEGDADTGDVGALGVEHADQLVVPSARRHRPHADILFLRLSGIAALNSCCAIAAVAVTGKV